MRLAIAAVLALPLLPALPGDAPAQVQAPGEVLRFAPPEGVPLRYRIEARRDWRGGDTPAIAGTTRYEVELRFGPAATDGGRRMTWRLLELVQEGAGPAGATGTPGAPDIAGAVAQELKAQPVEVELYASGAVRGLANWPEVAAAFDRAAARLAALVPPPPEGTRRPRDAEDASVPGPAGALDRLGAAAASELLLRDLAPLLGWGGLPVGGAGLSDFARLRVDGLGAGAIARRERSLVRLPDGQVEARLALAPAEGALADTVRSAGRAAPARSPRRESERPAEELRRLEQAEIAETARARLDPATGLPAEGVIERRTRAPGLFEQTETVTVARLS